MFSLVFGFAEAVEESLLKVWPNLCSILHLVLYTGPGLYFEKIGLSNVSGV